MRRNDVSLVRLLAFGFLLSTMLLGSGCSGGSDSSGGDSSANLGAPPDPGTISLSCQRLSSAVRVSLSQPYEYEIRLYEPSGSSRSISWGGRITSHSFNYSFDQLGFGNKTFRAVWTYVGSSNSPAFGQRTERQCTVNIPRPEEPPPPPPEEPDLFCEYSREYNTITMTVSFGGYAGPFYLALVQVRGSFIGWSDEWAPDEMIVTSDGEQFTYGPRPAGTYEFALKDASRRTVATCSVNVRAWTQTHASCCFNFVPDAECPNGGVATYIFPLFLAVQECTRFGPCSGCFPDVIDNDGSHPEIPVVRGSAVIYVPCIFLEGYLEEGWGPPDGFRDEPVAIWIHECRQ